jgi:hypothetical protein
LLLYSAKKKRFVRLFKFNTIGVKMDRMFFKMMNTRQLSGRKEHDLRFLGVKDKVVESRPG